MIDVHCHLEQKDYDKDRDQVIEKCKKELKAVITCAAHPKDFQLTLDLVKKNKNFIFCSMGLHPEYIKEFTEDDKDIFFNFVKENKGFISAVGEVGLDFNWVKEPEWQKKQKEQFIEFINFSKEIKKPLVVHSRDAYEDVIKILEQEDAKKVHLHLFGANQLVPRVIENKWFISIGPMILRSKKHFQIARDMPLDLLFLETDAPWNHPSVFLEGKKQRNDPTSIRVVAEEIAEIKKISFEEVWKKCAENAINFFDLPISI